MKSPYPFEYMPKSTTSTDRVAESLAATTKAAVALFKHKTKAVSIRTSSTRTTGAYQAFHVRNSVYRQRCPLKVRATPPASSAHHSPYRPPAAEALKSSTTVGTRSQAHRDEEGWLCCILISQNCPHSWTSISLFSILWTHTTRTQRVQFVVL
jgi:hypothetical protein